MTSTDLPGGPLAESDYQSLARCYISRELADAAHLKRVSDLQARALLGINGRSGRFSGLLIPYFDFDPPDDRVVSYRIRRDEPDLEECNGSFVARAKYLSASGGRNHLYIPPWVPLTWLKDTTIPLVVVEGEKKALAMRAIVQVELGKSAERPCFVPVGLSGVWSWRGRVGKKNGPDGKSRDVRGVIPDLRRLAFLGREVRILFDTNVRTNSHVLEARHQLAGWLSGQGALVRLAELPAEPGVNGPDDLAAKHGPEYILDVLARACPAEKPDYPRVLSPDEEKAIAEQPYGGFLRVYQDYAHGRLPEVPIDYHTLIGLVLMGGILGGKLSTSTDLRPNVAGVIVAFQGSGKSYPSVIARQLIDPIEKEEEQSWRAQIRDLKQELRQVEAKDGSSHGSKSNQAPPGRTEELLEQIDRVEQGGRPAIVLATQASVEGLLEALSCASSGIADYDEFGAFLKECGRDHMRSARENLIKALDGRSIFYRRARKQSVDASHPCLSLWGTVNVESLRAAATDEDMFGGLFSRILFCAPDYEFVIPVPKEGNEQQAHKLRDTIRRWRGLGAMRVEFEAGVEDRARDYAYAIAPFVRGERITITEPEDQVAAVVYVRYRTHALKIAILIAAGESENWGESLNIQYRHILLAIHLVEQFRRQAVRLLRYLEKRDLASLDMECLKAKIRRSPGRDRADYQRMTHWKADRFNKAMCELERLREVRWDDEASTARRTRRVYFPR